MWKHFGTAAHIETPGSLKPASELDKMDFIIQKIDSLIRENASRRQKREFNLALDDWRVRDWAASHNAKDAYNMGPRNFQRCLFDLGLEGGVYHELSHDAENNLQYQ